MNILFVGDITGSAGLEKARQELGRLRRQYQADVVIVNGENAAERNGITEKQFRDLRFAGADVVTLGNHAWANSEIYQFIDREDAIIRPLNYPEGTAGKGYTIVDLGRVQLAVVNLLGNVYVSTLPSPFTMIDAVLQDLKQQNVRHIIIDFHGEATSEKMAFANYVDGRVSAVLGTHTHVQTADGRILPKGTAYISDVGMTGVVDSVLGVKTELAIQQFMTQIPVRFQHAEGKAQLCGVVVELDDKTGKATVITPLQV
ncbi:MAG: TIGR00282 family metallophosphoesterase [Peptococcaceae bacterium]